MLRKHIGPANKGTLERLAIPTLAGNKFFVHRPPWPQENYKVSITSFFVESSYLFHAIVSRN